MQSRTVDEILVVDNGSIDESQTMIRERYPEVTLIELGENKGFSVANNIGIRRAKGDYIALLNNDLLLDGEWMTHMIDALDADPSLGSCASKMLFYDQRDILDSAGISVLKHGTGINRGHFERDGAPLRERLRCLGLVLGLRYTERPCFVILATSMKTSISILRTLISRFGLSLRDITVCMCHKR
jgi:GT2 family glycosyltransferase